VAAVALVLVAAVFGWRRLTAGASSAATAPGAAGDTAWSAGTVAVAAEARGDTLVVELRAAPGFRIVRRPANEVWLDGRNAAPVGFLGEPYSDTDIEVQYFDGPASVAIPLGPGLARRAHGRVVYRACDDRTGLCLQRDVRFDVPGS